MERSTAISIQVKDPNTGQEKYWIVSKRTSEQVDAFLIEGHNLLKIQRLPSGNDTRYNILAVVNPPAFSPFIFSQRVNDQRIQLVEEVI